MSSSVLIHESRFIGPTRPYNCHRSKYGVSRMGFAFTGVAAVGLPVMGFSLAAQPVQGVERLEFKPEGCNFWTWRGHKIHYVVQGEGPPVVLIIHGFGASAFHWRVGQKYKVYAIDLLGFGWSEKALVDYDALVWRDQVVDFAENGRLVIFLNTGLPERVVGVALLNSAGQFGNPNSEAEKSREETALQKFILKPLKEVFQRVVLGFFVLASKVYKNTANADDYLVESIVMPAADPNAGEVYYSKMSCPLLLVWGDLDPWVGPAKANTIKALLDWLSTSPLKTSCLI
ncbi:unnamed protein product [Malus baccata var. baccata]